MIASPPDTIGALLRQAQAMLGLGRIDDAADTLMQAMEISPSAQIASNLALVIGQQGDHSAAVAACRHAISLDPDYVPGWTNLLYSLDHHPGATAELRMAERRAFNARHCAALTAAAPPYTNDRDPERQLRVGFVSGDFNDHSASLAFLPVILGHSDAIEAVLYDTSTLPADDVTAMATGAAVRRLSVCAWSDADLAAQIRADRIDILVDLSGYSGGNRLLTFARKPAPIQITGWGHATGTGLDCMDYLASDAVTIPPDQTGQYRERIMYLPSALAFDPRPPYPDVAEPPANRNGYPTFGYLGRGSKLNERCLSAWAAILRRQPHARLLLKSPDYHSDTLRERVMTVLVALGVDPERVSVRGSTSRYDHLATYNEIDVHLDPFPHGGGVTTLEACLMGVPTVTMLGDYASARIGAAILSTVYPSDGTTATDTEMYMLLAQAALLGASLHERQRLRRKLLESVICDQAAYARAFEAACRVAWREWCQS
jgi:protein O-GlcNAc transferase